MELSWEQIGASSASSVGSKFLEDLFRFHHYRNHRLFRPEEIRDLACTEMQNLLRSKDILGYAITSGEVMVAVCLLGGLEWDTEFFGAKMARLDCWASDALPEEYIETLIKRTLDLAKRKDFSHVSFHVDADDYRVFNAAVGAGFRLRDTKRTFVARKSDRMNFHGVRLFKPRPYASSDREAVLDLFRNSKFVSRFARDPSISEEKSRLLNVRWIESLIDKDAGEVISLVVERGDKIVAATSVVGRHIRSGISARKILTDGIFACSPKASGSYLAVMRGLVETSREQGYDLIETKVSLNNLPVNRALQFIGGDAVTCHFALHKTL